MKPPKLVPALLSLLVAAGSAPGEIVERIVARVNGEILTQSEFVSRQAAAVQASRVANDRVERFLRENNARILQEAIDDLLIVQRADELGIRLRPEYVKDVIDGIKKENNIESDEALVGQLRREGMTLDDLKRNIQRSILKRQVLQRELESRAVVTDDEARADYESRKEEYARPATVRLQEILVKAEEGRDALQLAREIVTRARAGEDFATLARQHSASPTRDTGGELGTLARGELHADVEKVAFSLGAGEVSEPVPTGEGYRVLKVVERTEGSVVPFDQAKAEILRRLSQERASKEYESYVEELRKRAVIDIKVREVPLQLNVPGVSPPGPEVPAPSPRPRPALPEGIAIPEVPEVTTTPQAAPERVVPGPLPGEKPAPSPTPSPSPGPPLS